MTPKDLYDIRDISGSTQDCKQRGCEETTYALKAACAKDPESAFGLPHVLRAQTLGCATLHCILLPPQGTSRKKVMRVQRQERAAEAESNFMAQVFHTGMDDWEEDDIFAED